MSGTRNLMSKNGLNQFVRVHILIFYHRKLFVGEGGSLLLWLSAVLYRPWGRGLKGGGTDFGFG